MAKGKYEYWLTEDGLILLEGWARDGLTDEQLAKDKIGISTSTLYVWKKKYLEISEALKKGKEVVDREVENALFKRAKGFTFDETTKERLPETGELVTTKIVTKQIAPDTTACIFWLKNRKPIEWRDRPAENIVDTGQLESLINGLMQDDK